MKIRFFAVILVVVLLSSVGMSIAEDVELHFDRFYLALPAMDLRADPQTPGRVDTIYAGQEVDVIDMDGIWCTFTYEKDAETRTGCTWTGAIAQAVRIHLLEDAFIYRLPYEDREEPGLIAAWREPSDPDLLIIGQEMGEDEILWYYVVCLNDCRGGYMLATTKFELVE